MHNRTFVLKSSESRTTIESTLPALVSKVEGHIRNLLPLCSAFNWEGSMVEGFWGVTALDAAHAPITEFDLFVTKG